jgi:hypothetical protein
MRFVKLHRDWIERARRRVAQARRVVLKPLAEWPPAELQLAALNEVWECRYQPDAGAARPLVVQSPAAGQAGMLLLRGTTGGADDDAADLRMALLDWLRARAGGHLLPALQVLAAQMNCGFQRLQIRLQRSRWGSCSRQGTISLNACLLFQRPEVVRYLLVHELAHRQHMNHGPRFWALVAEHEPEWRTLDRELAHGWQQVPRWALAKV